MTKKTTLVPICAWLALHGSLLPIHAQQAAPDADARLKELERKVEILSQELEQERMGSVIPSPGESQYGLGPAASKVYNQAEGVSIGGYGEALYQNFDDDREASADFVRAVLYVGNKFNENWVLNTEFEFEHASTDKEGSVSVEFATLDYLHSDAVNFRAGLVLVPMGFINEYHESTTYVSARRPDVESKIIPSTWRENGLGIFGELGRVSYKAYVVNGLKGSSFSAGGLRGGRQKGSEALAEDLAGVLKLDVDAGAGLTVGGSFYQGKSGQELSEGLDTQVFEVHAEWKWRGLQLRALATQATLDDVASVNRTLFGADSDGNPVADADIDSIGETLEGGYVELGYNLFNETRLSSALIPYVRWEQVNTQAKIPDGFKASAKNDVESITTGIAFRPIDQIIFKAEMQFVEDADGRSHDQFNLGMGYIF